MKKLLAIICFAVLVQRAGAQDLWNPDMNFNVSFSALNGESSNVVWWGMCGYNRSIRVPSYIPNAPIYTNDLEVNILFATLPDSMWILEKKVNGTFKTIAEITNGINGDNYNFVDQRFTLTKTQTHHLIKGDWYLEADYADNIFISQLEPQYDAAHGPTVVIQIESPFFQYPEPGIYRVIAKDNKKAVVVLDGFQSTDPFYLPMQFHWIGLQNESLVFTNNGAAISHTYPLGGYNIVVYANNAFARGKQSSISLNVITASEAVSEIVSVIPYLSVPDQQLKELNDTLSNASKLFDSGNMGFGCIEMSIFIRQLRATHANDVTATWILQAAKKIIQSVGHR